MDKFTYQKALHGQPAFKGHPAARVVLQVIIDYADGDLTNSWPSIRTIADAACVSTSTAREAIDYLVAQGFLKKEAGTRSKSNRYVTTLPRGVALTATPTTPEGTGGVALTATGCSDQRYTGVALTATDHALYQAHSRPEGAPADWDALSRLEQHRWLKSHAA